MSLTQYGYNIAGKNSEQRYASLRAATYALGIDNVIKQLMEYSDSKVIKEDLHYIFDMYDLDFRQTKKRIRVH